MATVLVRMRTTSATPHGGVLHEGKTYRVDAKQAQEWAQVHPGTGNVICEIVGDLEDNERVAEPEKEVLENDGENAPVIPKVKGKNK